MKNLFFLLVGFIIIFGSIFLFLRQPVKTTSSHSIKIGETAIEVEVADTPKARTKGLSGRTALSQGEGMLFIFDNPSIYGFWMKDMNFAIDIIWIDAESRVAGIEKQVSPNSFPQVFYPPKPVKYVLEIPARFSENHNINLGDIMLR